ncbi:MAG: hypothetical protein IJ062_01865 [Firmicutes bacterium]|nr:hypothetical protein [Bacillota bacterium]
MRYKVLKSNTSDTASPIISIIVGLVFIGAFALVIWICMGELSGNFSALNFARVAAEHFVELLITGFLGVVGVYILYSVFLQRPKMYLGEVTYKNVVAQGKARMEFCVAENEETAASSSGVYKIVVEDDGTINEGDMCIAEIKESFGAVKTLCKVTREEAEEIKQRGVISTGQQVKTQTNSFGRIMDILFKVIIMIFAWIGIASAYNLVMAFVHGRSVIYALTFIIPIGFSVTAVRYALRAKDKFVQDNARGVTQKPVGYGMELAAADLPRRILVERESFSVMGGIPSITVKNDYGMLIYHVHRHAVNNNAYDVETPDGESIAEIKYDPIDMESFKVNVYGAHPFSVRRKLVANPRSADYEIEGLDFYVHGNTAFTRIYKLDGTPVADVTAAVTPSGGYMPAKLSLEVRDGVDMNIYMILIAACISANNTRERRCR